jgi:hypothetical protein
LSSAAARTSPTTPTIVISGSLIENRSPIGSRDGQKRCAADALMIATSGRLSRSASSKSRPRSSGIRIARK